MLSTLQEQLADAHGLAIASATVLGQVEERVPRGVLGRSLGDLARDGEETRARCQELERDLGEELGAEILERAQAVHRRSADLVNAWFKAGTGPLEAWTFLAM